MLLHGLCSSPAEVRWFGRFLREHGFDVLTPRLQGYTASAESDREPRADHGRWIADAASEVERARGRYDEFYLCGVSLGATLAMAVAIEQRVCALSLISTTLFFDGWNVSRWRFLLPLVYHTPLARWYRYRETPPYGVKNERVREWVADRIEQGRLSSAGAPTIPTASLREAARLIRRVKRRLGEIRCPMLMIHSRDDDVASLENVRFVRRRAQVPLLGEIVVHDSYHMITIDNDSRLAATHTARFFAVAGREPASSLLRFGDVGPRPVAA